MNPNTFQSSSLQSNTTFSSLTNRSPPSSLTSTDSNSEFSRDFWRYLIKGSSLSEMEGDEDASVLMTQVLERMNKVVDHFRAEGETDAANRIARDIISMMTIFNQVVAASDRDLTIIRGRKVQHSSNNSTDISPHPRDQSAGGFSHVSRPSIGSWAAVAAVAPSAGNNVVKVAAPSSNLQKKANENGLVSKSSEDNKRVIWIEGWTAGRPISEITNQIGQGPIYSIAYSPQDRSMCIIFQYASSAKAVFDDDHLHVQRYGVSRFGPGCKVTNGLEWHENDDMRRMQSPTNERRRLTFARQQLFANGMTVERFKSDIYNVIGDVNVDLVWLFNSGNATVIFSAVPIARMIRDHFRALARNPQSPYHGVIISFSHDPCERPMHLTTQMPAGHSMRSMGMYGRATELPGDIVPKSRPPVRRDTHIAADADADGWQTVVGKKWN